MNTATYEKLQAENKALNARLLIKPFHCIWKEENEVDSDVTYVTSCDNMFTIIEGNPKDNDFKYCPYCGGELKEK